MNNNQAANTASPVQEICKKYLVVAADIAIKGNYHLVMTCAEDEDAALAAAAAALEDGFRPLIACTANELRQLADELIERQLKPREAYNVSADMSDLEMAE